MQKEVEKEGSKIKKQDTKLRNNALFGKSIENPVKEVDVKIINTRKQQRNFLNDAFQSYYDFFKVNWLVQY